MQPLICYFWRLISSLIFTVFIINNCNYPFFSTIQLFVIYLLQLCQLSTAFQLSHCDFINLIFVFCYLSPSPTRTVSKILVAADHILLQFLFELLSMCHTTVLTSRDWLPLSPLILSCWSWQFRHHINCLFTLCCYMVVIIILLTHWSWYCLRQVPPLGNVKENGNKQVPPKIERKLLPDIVKFPNIHFLTSFGKRKRNSRAIVQ